MNYAHLDHEPSAELSRSPRYECPMHPDVVSDTPGRCRKCNMSLVRSTTLKKNEITRPQTLQDYTALIVIIGLILFSSIFITFTQDKAFSLEKLISYFMIGFFIVFGGFKLLDLKGFAHGYSTYDLLAMRLPVYGYLYPFLELFFGYAMIISSSPFLLGAEIIIMVFSGLGVVVKLFKRQPVQCVCLGTLLKVPLSTVTLIEDFGMAILALVLLAL